MDATPQTSTVLDIIRRKRDGETLSAEDCVQLANGIAGGHMSDAQVGAFSMATFCRGMTIEESAALTQSMTNTGWRCDWTELDLGGPLLDKHSTGGLGDIVSFLLAPMVAACGGYIPMISGRSLGHTGGTVDKLESIPGYNPFPEPDLFQATVKRCGLAIVGQTAQLVPADQRLYAVRDETATVESLPLIAASILSKKLAEGLNGLVIDLKVGSGAFMQNQEQGFPLRDALLGVADRCGMNCRVLFTNMDQPLANCVGDGVEVREAVRYLTGERRTHRLHEITLRLAGELLILGGLANDLDGAQTKLQATLDSGQAAERFQRMISNLGGPTDFMENADLHLNQAAVVQPVMSAQSGRVTAIDGPQLGNSVHDLARVGNGTCFDHCVGIAELVELEQEISTNQPIAEVHARNESEYETLADAVRRAVTISEH